ncbi:(2Fe-2S)-binding protein [Kitasatospora sp. NPDC054939]
MSHRAAPTGSADPGPGYDRLAQVGPYFALLAAAAPTDTPPPGFRPLRELYATGPDGLLAGRVREVGRQLGTAEPRVAASILHLGLAARFWSVGLGAAVLLGTVPDLHPDRAQVRVPERGPVDLWLPYAPRAAAAAPGADPDPGPGPAPDLADALHRTVLLGQLAPLAAAVRSAAPVSAGLLRGNAASALVGAVKVLRSGLPDPAAGRTAEALAVRLLAREPLAGTHTLPFRRTSCCLYYRVGPGAGICGDCCFDRPPR